MKKINVLDHGFVRLVDHMGSDGAPLEAVEFQFEVKAPIFVFRSWDMHRTWAFSQLLVHYCELREEFYVPDPFKIDFRSKDNKLGSDTAVASLDRRADVDMLRKQCEESFATYRKLLKAGWPMELARSVLPVATYSHTFVKVDLLNLMKFLDLRLHEYTQCEIRVYAEAMANLAETVAPIAMATWRKEKWHDDLTRNGRREKT